MKIRNLFLLAALAALLTVPAATAAVPAPTAFGHLDVGSKLYYETYGDEGPVLVLIHDGLVHREVWDAQIATFSAAHRVVRYDRRGYGRSEPPAKAYSNVADLEVLGVGRAHLVGHSMGGGNAVDFALEHPEKVRSLILAASDFERLQAQRRGFCRQTPGGDRRVADGRHRHPGRGLPAHLDRWTSIRG